MDDKWDIGIVTEHLEEIEAEIAIMQQAIENNTNAIRSHIQQAADAPPEERQEHLRKAFQLLDRYDGSPDHESNDTQIDN